MSCCFLGLWKSIKDNEVWCIVSHPWLVCKMNFFLSGVDFFPSTFQSCSLELCVPMYIHKALGSLGMSSCGLWFLSFEHAAWSWMAQVLLLCLSSHSLVVTCPAWGPLKQLCYIIIMCKTSCSSKQKVHAFISLNDQG